jgi:epoxyqueuosine reductase
MQTGECKERARVFGADLVGIASRDRFESVGPERNPLSIFPEMRSLIVIGRRILRGAMRGVEEGTNMGSTYGMFGYRWLEDNFLSRTTYDLTCWMETQGFEAVPLFGYTEDGMPKGRPVEDGRPAPNVIVDTDYAAHAAGLGEVGLGGFFLTPEYGTRQRFALILTDADLDADPVRDKSICADCGACVAACPLGAIDTAKTKRVGVPGHEMDVAEVNYEICRSCPNGAMNAPGRGTRPDRLAAACGRMCMVQLEAAGKCGNRFENQFRKREPWALDVLRRPVNTPTQVGKYGCDDLAGNRA